MKAGQFHREDHSLPVRTGDNPEDASEVDTERNEIAVHCVARQPEPDLSRQTT